MLRVLNDRAASSITQDVSPARAVAIFQKVRPMGLQGQAGPMEHRYTLTVTWTGNTGEGTSAYRGYKRTHKVTAEGPPELLGSADRTFHGDRERWNPEQLFLASLAQCHMLSYLHVCVDAGVVVTHYVDHPAGSMKTESDGSGRFTEVVLHPKVTVADASMVEAATDAHHRANELCFIANSVNFRVRHEPAMESSPEPPSPAHPHR